MKNVIQRIAVSLCIIILFSNNCRLEAAEEFRVWKLPFSNSQFEAAYITQSGNIVLFKTKNGAYFRQSIQQFSQEDQKLLAGLPRTLSPYLQISASSSARQIVSYGERLLEQKQAKIENQRLILQEVPVLFGRGAEYVAAKELRKAIPQQSKPEVASLTDNEIDQLRAKLLAPSVTPIFKKESEFVPGWRFPPEAKLSQDGRYLAALIAGTANTQTAIEVWDLGTGKMTSKVVLHDGSRSSAWSISPQGNYLAYSNRENNVIIHDLRADKGLYAHKAAAWAEESVARVAFGWNEREVYFLSQYGLAYRFPIAGGRGTSIKTSFGEGAGPLPGYAQFSVSEDGENISCIASGNKMLAIPLPLPTALIGLEPQRTTIEYLPAGSWQGHVLNQGLVASDKSERSMYLIRMLKPFAADEYSIFYELGTAASRNYGNQFSIDRAERFAWKAGKGPDGAPGLDIYDLSYFHAPVSIPLPYTESRSAFENDKFWISAEGKRFVLYNRDDNRVQVFNLTEWGPPPAQKIHMELRRCLMCEEYLLLDKLAAPFFKEEAPIPGSTGLPAALEIVMSFRDCAQYYETNSSYARRLRRWQQACPESRLARLVVAYDAICRGFAARGNSTADEVTDEGWRDLRKYGQEADEVLAPLFKLDRPPSEAYLLQLRVALMLSWDKEKQLDLMARMIDLAPGYFPFHQQAVLNLLPRWSGELGDCQTYAAHVAKKIGGDAGEIMYGRLAVELMKYYDPERYFAEINFDMQRAFNGLLLWCKTSTDDSLAPLYVFFCHTYCDGNRLVTDENKDEFSNCKKSCIKLLRTFTWNASAERSHPALYKFISRIREYTKD
jgi:hypothetical protein